MSSSWTLASFLILCSSVFCMAQLEAESINYEVLNSHDTTKHTDCSSLQRAGYTVSGIYRLSLNNKPVNMPCEFRDGNAFTVILRRTAEASSFRMARIFYDLGFGKPEGDFWAGLENMYNLTNTGPKKSLQINMQDWNGEVQNISYSSFRLDSGDTRFKLNVEGYKGNIPDNLKFQNKMPFSTYDYPDPKNCALKFFGGWWYMQNDICTLYLPTGRYYPTSTYEPCGITYDGMFYRDWHGFNYTLKAITWSVSG